MKTNAGTASKNGKEAQENAEEVSRFVFVLPFERPLPLGRLFVCFVDSVGALNMAPASVERLDTGPVFDRGLYPRRTLDRRVVSPYGERGSGLGVRRREDRPECQTSKVLPRNLANVRLATL